MLRKSARWPRYSVVELHHVAIYSEVELAAKLHSIMSRIRIYSEVELHHVAIYSEVELAAKLNSIMSMIRIYSEVELHHVAIYSEVELHHVAIYSEVERPLPSIAQGLVVLPPHLGPNTSGDSSTAATFPCNWDAQCPGKIWISLFPAESKTKTMRSSITAVSAMGVAFAHLVAARCFHHGTTPRRP